MRKKRLITLGAVVLLLASMACLSDFTVFAGSTAVTGIGEYVKLRHVSSEPVRAGADPSASRLGTLENGKKLELMQKSPVKYNDYTYYFKVVYGSQVGYIRTRYMDAVRPDDYFAVQPDYSAYTNYVRVVRSGKMNVRSSADLKSKTNKLTRKAEHGDVLALKSTTKTNGCWKVEFDGQTAYISAGENYTERVSPTAIPSDNTSAQNATWVAVVNQTNQTISVYKDKTLIRFSTCTTGGDTEDRLTPVGTFTHNKEMRGMPGKKSLFLSWHTSDEALRISGLEDLTVFDCVRVTGSVYIHRIPRKANNSYKFYRNHLNAPGSHGCIRIPEVHSRWMYTNFEYGGVIVVQPFA